MNNSFERVFVVIATYAVGLFIIGFPMILGFRVLLKSKTIPRNRSEAEAAITAAGLGDGRRLAKWYFGAIGALVFIALFVGGVFGLFR